MGSFSGNFPPVIGLVYVGFLLSMPALTAAILASLLSGLDALYVLDFLFLVGCGSILEAGPVLGSGRGGCLNAGAPESAAY